MAREAQATYVNVSTDERASNDFGASAGITHARVQRRFDGAIAGQSVATALIARGTPDRLGYVATDEFKGTVDGRAGTFVFQHGGTIDRGVLTPFGYVIPGSGTGELAGLTGSVCIRFIPPSTHTLTLQYTFEE